MKLFSLLIAALFVTAAQAKPLTSKIESIKGQVKLLIDMNQVSDPVDILFVIDNSGSMQVYQNQVLQSTNAFIDNLSKGGLDWHIGLVSTTVGEQPYIGMVPGTELNHATVDGPSLFKLAVGRLGINGDGIEKAFDSASMALKTYPGFLRSNARLAVILISDAPEQSAITTADFVNQLVLAKGGDASKVSFYGFLNPQDWCAPTDDVFVWAGSKFQDLLTKISGDAKPLCAADFGVSLTNVGTTLNTKSRSGKSIAEIPLPSVPDFATLTVNFGTQIIDKGIISTGWIYDSTKNSVLLGDKIPWSAQPAGTPLEVTYTPQDWK